MGIEVVFIDRERVEELDEFLLLVQVFERVGSLDQGFRSMDCDGDVLAAELDWWGRVILRRTAGDEEKKKA